MADGDAVSAVDDVAAAIGTKSDGKPVDAAAVISDFRSELTKAGLEIVAVQADEPVIDPTDPVTDARIVQIQAGMVEATSARKARVARLQRRV